MTTLYRLSALSIALLFPSFALSEGPSTSGDSASSPENSSSIGAAGPDESFGPPSEAQILDWIHRLDSDSYASRNLALQLLEPFPELAIKHVKAAVAKADQDAAISLIRLLDGWAIHPDEGYGNEAFLALEEIAKGGVSTKSTLAKNVLNSLAEEQSVKASKYLEQLAAFIGNDTIQVVTSPTPNQFMLRIDDAFRGTDDDLRCVRWLDDVQLVRLDGKRIDRKWLEKIVTIPNLKILQLRRTSIKSEDVEILRALGSLDTLEIIYTPVGDSAIDTLADLSFGTIRLFGTEITAEGLEKLKTQLEGVNIVHGRGGFLGIGTSVIGLEVTQVTVESGAEKAGIRVGDRIISLEGKQLANFEQLRKELARFAPGDKVIVEIERVEYTPDRNVRRVRRKLTVTLGEQP